MTPFVYICRGFRVIDGDTIDCLLDLGFRTSHDVHIRLEGINAPEKRGVEKVAGIPVTKFVKDLFDAHEGDVLCRSTKLDKFAGRAIGDFSFTSNGIQIPSLSRLLLTTGLAEPYDGGKRGGFDHAARLAVLDNIQAARTRFFPESSAAK